MKNFILSVAVLAAMNGYSQTCTLSGQVADSSGKLTLLYADQVYKTYEMQIGVNPEGRFKKSISLPYPVFALLELGSLKRRLLLSPGRHLEINIDGSYAGKGAVENNLVHSGILDNTPSFTKNVTLRTWKDSIMNRVEKAIAQEAAAIEAAKMPAPLKKILISETKYAWQCYLNDFTSDDLRWAKNPDADSLAVLVMQWQPIPDSLTLVNGFYANMILQRHGRHNIQVFLRHKPVTKESFGAYLGMSYNKIDSLVRIHGEPGILGWLYTRNHAPAGIRDKMIYNSIVEATDVNDLSTATFLYQHMQKDHPGSNYLAAANRAMQQVKNAMESNAGNTGIRFNQAGGIHSLQELVTPYAGKVVYLDIWGTWCGPCREQLKYAHELKKRYAGKDVVFVYLDKDDQVREGIWKEYVYVAKLEGEHYRMSQEEIEGIWHSVKEAGNEQVHSYPTYVIIDRQGRIVHPNAERPGSREKLYAQLDKLL